MKQETKALLLLGAVAGAVVLLQRREARTAAQLVADAKRELDRVNTPVRFRPDHGATQ